MHLIQPPDSSRLQDPGSTPGTSTRTGLASSLRACYQLASRAVAETAQALHDTELGIPMSPEQYQSLKPGDVVYKLETGEPYVVQAVFSGAPPILTRADLCTMKEFELLATSNLEGSDMEDIGDVDELEEDLLEYGPTGSDEIDEESADWFGQTDKLMDLSIDDEFDEDWDY
jgi:hypothetical protein